MTRPPRLAALVLGVVLLSGAAPAGAAETCTDVPSRSCLLPFPNDAALTRADASSATGRRVALPAAAMPANKAGKRIVPTEWNRNDGFSPGQPILARVPGLDSQKAFARSKIVPVTDLAQYARKDQPVLLLDAKTHKRQLIYAELDANAPKRPLLIIHPGRNLVEGRRYVVVLRGLRTASGRLIAAPRTFAAIRDGRRKDPRTTAALAVARKAGVKPRSVYLAWDFTVISTRSLTGRAVHIRDDAFAQLGDRTPGDGVVDGSAPRFMVTEVKDYAVEDNAQIARQVSGTVDVPCYLDQPGCPPGARFRYASKAPDALPAPDPANRVQAAWVCNIPRVATPDAPARLSLYGHGLLGKATEIEAGNVRDMSQEHDMVFCATPWAGMAAEDIPNAIKILGEFSSFPSLVDRLQQGFVNAMYLGRAMIAPGGLASDPAFQVGGRPVIDTANLYYDGNSQGGILGGALAALEPDIRRVVLGVPGMNFSSLLPRSTDFDTYRAVLDPAYPDRSVQPVILALVQMLWDRGENDGYANHITANPLPGTPVKTVLLHPAFGDHQVSTYTANVLARTIGARVRQPALAPGRSPDVDPLFGIPALPALPVNGGSAIVYWDSGNPAQPTTNTPPRTGKDPHEDPRATPAAREQKSAFLTPAGTIIDPCPVGQPCRSAAFTGAGR